MDETIEKHLSETTSFVKGINQTQEATDRNQPSVPSSHVASDDKKVSEQGAKNATSSFSEVLDFPAPPKINDDEKYNAQKVAKENENLREYIKKLQQEKDDNALALKESDKNYEKITEEKQKQQVDLEKALQKIKELIEQKQRLVNYFIAAALIIERQNQLAEAVEAIDEGRLEKINLLQKENQTQQANLNKVIDESKKLTEEKQKQQVALDNAQRKIKELVSENKNIIDEKKKLQVNFKNAKRKIHELSTENGNIIGDHDILNEENEVLAEENEKLQKALAKEAKDRVEGNNILKREVDAAVELHSKQNEVIYELRKDLDLKVAELEMVDKELKKMKKKRKRSAALQLSFGGFGERMEQ